MQIKKLTPNLIARNVEASLKFYQEILGLETAITVPEQSPYPSRRSQTGRSKSSSTTRRLWLPNIPSSPLPSAEA